MFKEPIRIASSHNTDRNFIAQSLITAVTDADLKIEPREKILKIIENLIKNQIETWKESKHPIKKIDIKNASKRLVNDLMKQLEKENVEVTLQDTPIGNRDPEEIKLELLSKIIDNVIVDYVSGYGLKVSSKEKTELMFNSEDEALQYLADFTGKKVKVPEK